MIRTAIAGLATVFTILGTPGHSRSRVAGGLLALADTNGRIHLTIAPTGNEARYKVREQLADVALPNDAIGKTTGLTGTLVFERNGKLVSDASRIVVDLTGLKSDRDRRDQFVQRRTLETDKFPTAVLVPTAVTGLPWPLPASGALAFDLTGNFTVHGVTRPTTWHVSATAAPDGFSGTAATIVTFTGLSLDPPRMGFILSLADTIHLEYDFHLIRGAIAGR